MTATPGKEIRTEVARPKPAPTLATPVPICWAFNSQRQRCDMPGGHLGDHGRTVTWSEGEVFQPEMAQALPSPTQGGFILTNRMEESYDYEADVLSSLGASPNGTCFSCSCLEEDHPCEPHSCRSFVL